MRSKSRQTSFYLIILVVILILVLSGCTKTEFIYPDIPELVEAPKPKHYNLNTIKINNQEYYSLSEADAKILSENWINYKAWAEYNFELLKEIKNQAMLKEK